MELEQADFGTANEVSLIDGESGEVSLYELDSRLGLSYEGTDKVDSRRRLEARLEELRLSKELREYDD